MPDPSAGAQKMGDVTHARHDAWRVELPVSGRATWASRQKTLRTEHDVITRAALWTLSRMASQERVPPHAIAAGYFDEPDHTCANRRQSAPRHGGLCPDDEHPTAATTGEALSGQTARSLSRKTAAVTAGNASGINDGAGCDGAGDVQTAAEKAGLTPQCRVSWGYAHAGVRPEVMGIGPVPAVENLLGHARACRSTGL